ncbi:MAG: hypothetical protein RSC68_23745, partial [Acinetobacter sp.]
FKTPKAFCPATRIILGISFLLIAIYDDQLYPFNDCIIDHVLFLANLNSRASLAGHLWALAVSCGSIVSTCGIDATYTV